MVCVAGAEESASMWRESLTELNLQLWDGRQPLLMSHTSRQMCATRHAPRAE